MEEPDTKSKHEKREGQTKTFPDMQTENADLPHPLSQETSRPCASASSRRTKSRKDTGLGKVIQQRPGLRMTAGKSAQATEQTWEQLNWV